MNTDKVRSFFNLMTFNRVKGGQVFESSVVSYKKYNPSNKEYTLMYRVEQMVFFAETATWECVRSVGYSCLDELMDYYLNAEASNDDEDLL